MNEPVADDSIDLGEIFLALKRHWRKIAFATAVFSLGAIIHVLLAQPEFIIPGSLYLGDARQSAPVGTSSELSYLSDYQAVSDINTEVDVLKSKGLTERAVLESGFNAPVSRAGAHKMRFWRWALWDGQDVNAFAPQPGDLQAVDVTFDNATDGPLPFAITIGRNGTYTVALGGGLFSSPAPIVTGHIGQPASGGGLSLLLKPLIDGALPEPGEKFNMTFSSAENVADALPLNGLLSISSGGIITNPTKIANLQLVTHDPFAGQRFLNQLMSDFITTQVSWNNQAASATENFISNQLDGIQTSLAGADQKLASFQSQTGIIDVPENAKAVIAELSQYETQRTAVALQREALQQLAAEIAHPTGQLNPYLLSQTGDAVLNPLATNLADEEVKLQALQVQFTDNAPDVQVEEASISRLKLAITSVVGNELAMAQSNLTKMDAMIAQFNAQLKNMPAESLQVVALTRASDVYGQIYVLLMQKDEEAEVSKAAQIVGTRVVTPPEIPLQAGTPKPVQTVAMGVFLGLFVGVTLTLLQRSLSACFQSEDEVRRVVKLPVYGVVPQRPAGETKRGVLLPHPQTPFAEAIRMLRGNIYRSAAPHQSRVILISSSGIDDGKTTIAINLAKMFADGGKNVVLMDADLHKGRMHEDLNVNAAPGLTEWLVTTTIQRVQDVPGQRFKVLSAGILPPNPSELLNEPFLKNIIAGLKNAFEYVIVDSPPLPAVSDGLILGELSDLVLSVIMVRHTSRQVFAVHNSMIEGLGGRHGLIINGVAGNAYGYGYRESQDGLMTKLMHIVERV